MKTTLTAFIDQLMPYDYLLFGGTVLLFVLLLLLALLLRRRLALALTCVLGAFAILVLGPTLGYVQLHHYLFKHETALTEVKALEFTDALLVRGTLTNTSKRDFERCRVSCGVYKVTHNTVLDLLYPHVPFKQGNVETGPLPRGERAEFKIFVEPFGYTKEYNVTIGAECR